MLHAVGLQNLTLNSTLQAVQLLAGQDGRALLCSGLHGTPVILQGFLLLFPSFGQADTDTCSH